MRRSNNGSLFIVFLFVSLCFSMMFVFVVDVGRAFVEEQKCQTQCDETLLSSLRLRVDALTRITDRWGDVGKFMVSGDASGVRINQSDWVAAKTAASKLSTAIPGYKGRIKAVMTVVRGANGVDESRFTLVDDDALNLGVSAAAVTMWDENGASSVLSGGWVRRLWSPGAAMADPPEISRLDGVKKVGDLTVNVVSRGRLVWDVDKQNTLVQQKGNSGLPRVWTEALDGAAVDPFRWPYFRAELVP